MSCILTPKDLERLDEQIKASTLAVRTVALDENAPRANRIHPVPLIPQWEEKKWGGELTYCNNDEFCGKLLKFKKGARFSCHMHLKKREVFVLRVGRISLMTINPEDASQHTRILSEGDVIEIPRLCPHQITALEDSEVIEFSTHHEDSDSYRVLPGDSQKPSASNP